MVRPKWEKGERKSETRPRRRLRLSHYTDGTMASTPQRRFPKKVVEALDKAKILGVRAGLEHRYTGIWVVVVEGRVFARSWNDKESGWFRAFREEPRGSIQFGDTVLEVRATAVRSARIRDAVTAAYAEKYDTKASKKWVDGFALPDRVANTMEFTPL